jgi:hypothetical protein
MVPSGIASVSVPASTRPVRTFDDLARVGEMTLFPSSRRAIFME